MSTFKPMLAILCMIAVLGAGCEKAYVPGEVPTEGQLEVMTDAEKDAGMKAMMDKEVVPEREQSQVRVEEEKMLMMMDAGTAERLGDFTGRAHDSTGKARIVKNGDRYSLVFDEMFTVDAGPQLFVFLSGNTNPSNSAELHAQGALEVGRLKSTKGVQVYELPEGTDINAFKSVVVYCKPFRVIFSVASFQ